ncbi:MAG: tyrosine--tRNA ligase, partial [Solirubrobacteraceae bacterium]
KDSVKKRINAESNEGMSFTEFTYQLLQGYDFLHLFKNYNCTLQIGGSDQWGNITTGTELIRRIGKESSFAFTCPLTTKSDGTKFGKSESGDNIWLDETKTSPYKFYQFWLNTTDIDAEKYIKIYTFLAENEIKNLITTHKEAPHNRILQKKLALELTEWVHGEKALENVLKATNLLFGNSTQVELSSIDEPTFLSIFEGVPKSKINKDVIEKGLNIVDLLAVESNFLASKGEAIRALAENSIYVNKERVTESTNIDSTFLINNKYLLLQRGKKKYYILSVE